MVETPNYAAAALLLPPTGLLLLALAGLAIRRRWRRTGLAVTVLALLGLLAASLPVVAAALVRTLEPAPLGDPARFGAQAIVVLGGGRNRSAAEWGGVTVNLRSLQRLRYGAHLARETRLPLMVSGGAPAGTGAPEGELMRAILRDEFGLVVRWTDSGARTTRDNARYAAAELLPLGIRRVLLVTDAWHMPRARAEFERHGFEPIAAATGFIGPRPFSPYHLVPNAESLYYTHVALREWLAAFLYRLTA
jgi:uncharacterized SAM-binding protein YcdF (DUF218 family)